MIIYGAACCGNSNEASDSMNNGDFLDYLNDNRLPEEEPSAFIVNTLESL